MKLGVAIGALAALALAEFAVSPAAHAADYGGSRALRAETMDRGFTHALPACHDPSVVASVRGNFAATEREYWSSPLELSDFHRPREIGFEPWGADFIPRRFCQAGVVTNDGRKRRVDYSIREGQSFGSFSWGVEWCVTGIDRHYSYAPRCKMARP